MKLLPYPLDVFLNYPMRFYVKSFFVAAPKADMTLILGKKRTSLLLGERKSGQLLFADDVSDLHGAPNYENTLAATFEPSNFHVNDIYRKTVAIPYGMENGGQVAVIFETTKLYDDISETKNGPKNIGQMIKLLKSEDVAKMIPQWNGTEPYEWTIFTTGVEPLRMSDPPDGHGRLMLSGIPESQSEVFTEWANTSGLILTAAVPLPIAVLDWMMKFVCADEVNYCLIVPGLDRYRAYRINNGEVEDYIYVQTQEMAEGELCQLLENWTIDHPESTATTNYVWLTESVDIKRALAGLSTSGLRNIVQIDAKLMKKRYAVEGAPSPEASLCDWIGWRSNTGHPAPGAIPQPLLIGDKAGKKGGK
jgi:hypothetical protein